MVGVEEDEAKSVDDTALEEERARREGDGDQATQWGSSARTGRGQDGRVSSRKFGRPWLLGSGKEALGRAVEGGGEQGADPRSSGVTWCRS
ncbi:hypothetical protein PR202_ga10421 [Eleusine coracana subsp. coracana]|uniref:Uncharacterized protein n=1 Tax=Eleusine coracana subsp. coracana TaxID=191504 RepID=A0AAV5C6M8_ELECO|nr:hypothetical protein PR202_ga10421 [Eleusine coracana subsp. coracana]